jgi:hypothetical protein
MAPGYDSRSDAGLGARARTGPQFIDASGRPVDMYGRPIDAYGRLVDAYGRPVDEYGRVVDEYGDPVDEGAAAVDRAASPSGRRRRRRIITPTRVTLFIALVGSVAFLAYAVTVRDTSQIPLLASGLAVLGIVFGALALSGARGAVGAGREGAGGRAFAMALSGGLASVIAFGCFGAAIVLALVWRP